MAQVTLPSISIPIQFDLSGMQGGLDNIRNLLGSLTAAIQDATNATKSYTDAQERLNQEQATTASTAQEAAQAVQNAGNAAEDAGKKSASSAGGWKSLNDTVDTVKKKLDAAGKSLQTWGNSVRQTGQNLSLGISAPLIGLGIAAAGAATRMDSIRKALTAIDGSADAADSELRQLQITAKQPGIGFEAAAQGAVRLQNVGVSAERANQLVSQMGNAIVRAGRGAEDLDGVLLILAKMQSMGRITQRQLDELAMRGVALAPILKAAFGTSNAKELAAAGVTTEQVFAKIIPAMEKMPRVTSGFANSFTNFKDAINQALVPLGNVIMPLVVKVMDQAIVVINKLVDSFKALSPQTQEAIVVFLAVVAALGPVLVAVGAVAAAIGAMGIPVAAAIAAFALLGTAFATNAGGIRDAAQRVIGPVAAFIRAEWEKLVSWWTQNLPLMRQTVQTVLNAIHEFWRAHGAQIVAIVKDAWGIVKTFIDTALNEILGIVTFAMQVVNGHWGEAWKTFEDVVIKTLTGIATILGRLGDMILHALVLLVTSIVDMRDRFAEAGRGLGIDIADGLLNGLKERIPALASAIQSIRDRFLPEGQQRSNARAAATAADAKQAADQQKLNNQSQGVDYMRQALSANAGRIALSTGKTADDSNKKDDGAAARADTRADGIRAAQKITLENEASAMQRTFDALKGTIDGKEGAENPAQFDAAIQQLRRLSDLITHKQTQVARADVQAAEAKLKVATDDDARASAEADLIKARATFAGQVGKPGNPLSGSIGADAQGRGKSIDDLKTSAYEKAQKAREASAKADQEMSAKSLKENLADLDKKRELGEISLADYRRLLKNMLASQQQGGEMQRDVQAKINEQRVKDHKRELEIIKMQDEAEGGITDFGIASGTDADLHAGATERSGQNDPIVSGIAHTLFLQKAAHEEALADWQVKVQSMAGMLESYIAPAIDQVFHGDWKGVLQVFAQEFQHTVESMVTQWLASGLAKLIVGNKGLSQDAASAEGHMIKGAAAIGIAAVALDRAAAKLQKAGDATNAAASGTVIPGTASALGPLGGLLSLIPGGGLLAGLGKLFGGGKGGGMFGSIGKLFGFSAGGILPDVAMVHKGEMLVQPRPGSMALPAALTRALLDGPRGGGQHITHVHIHGVDRQGMTVQEAAQEFNRHINRDLPVARRIPAGG